MMLQSIYKVYRGKEVLQYCQTLMHCFDLTTCTMSMANPAEKVDLSKDKPDMANKMYTLPAVVNYGINYMLQKAEQK